jgi:uncharacterized protein YukE
VGSATRGSFSKVAKLTGYNVTTIANYSREFKWALRIAAYDEFVARLMAEERLRLDRKTAQMEARMSNRLQRFLVLMADRLLEQAEKDSTMVLNPNALGQLAEAATRVARLGRGEATDRFDVNQKQSMDPTQDLVEALKKIQESAQKSEHP